MGKKIKRKKYVCILYCDKSWDQEKQRIMIEEELRDYIPRVRLKITNAFPTESFDILFF